ncbi:MAG: sugar phosphate isomerase/epimerase family protein [Planctomycetota bacterium]
MLARHGVRHIELTLRAGYVDLFDLGQLAFWKEAVVSGRIVAHSAHVYCDDVEPDLSSLNEDFRCRAVENVAARLDALASLATRLVVIHGSNRPVVEDDRPARLRWLQRSVGDLRAHARRHCVIIAVETMPFPHIPADQAEVLRVVEHCDPECVGICVDTNHLNLSGDLLGAIARLGRRIVAFHLSDNDGQEEKHWYPFEGVIDWKRVMRAIDETGYQGPLNFEFGMPEDLEADIRKRRQVFDRLMSLL